MCYWNELVLCLILRKLKVAGPWISKSCHHYKTVCIVSAGRTDCIDYKLIVAVTDFNITFADSTIQINWTIMSFYLWMNIIARLIHSFKNQMLVIGIIECSCYLSPEGFEYFF